MSMVLKDEYGFIPIEHWARVETWNNTLLSSLYQLDFFNKYKIQNSTQLLLLYTGKCDIIYVFSDQLSIKVYAGH